MVHFKFCSSLYRTDDDATVIEVHTGQGWGTPAHDVRGAALAALEGHRKTMSFATQVAPAGEKSRIATGTESARQTARTGSAGGGSAHPDI